MRRLLAPVRVPVDLLNERSLLSIRPLRRHRGSLLRGSTSWVAQA